jgi:dihydrolipoamide dehydrogenase
MVRPRHRVGPGNIKPKEMDSQNYDLIVVGSGAAGGAAARAARVSGLSVAMIEKDKPGGECPNYACVPTKALLRSAKVYSLLKRAEEFGLRAGPPTFDWGAVMTRKDRIVDATGAAIAEQDYKEVGITLIKGTASFKDAQHLRVGGRLLQGEKILIAAGSKPQIPKIDGLEKVKPITSAEAVGLKTLPASIIILGGGPVGCEFAQLFSAFGVEVSLLEMGATLLPHEEPELSEIVRHALERNGVACWTEMKVERLTAEGGRKGVQAEMAGRRQELRAEEILVATGREPQTADLNLGAAGVETEDGRVKIDEYLQTSQPHIYAAGDVCGPYEYTHFAHYQGMLAAQNMFSGEPQKADYSVVPRVTFTDPEVASVGLTEAQAGERGHHAVGGVAEIAETGKALVDSEGVGRVKIVGNAHTGEILGGHIVGPAAGEMIHEIVAAMRAQAKIADLADVIHAYPTYAEAIRTAASEWIRAVTEEQHTEHAHAA